MPDTIPGFMRANNSRQIKLPDSPEDTFLAGALFVWIESDTSEGTEGRWHSANLRLRCKALAQPTGSGSSSSGIRIHE